MAPLLTAPHGHLACGCPTLHSFLLNPFLNAELCLLSPSHTAPTSGAAHCHGPSSVKRLFRADAMGPEAARSGAYRPFMCTQCMRGPVQNNIRCGEQDPNRRPQQQKIACTPRARSLSARWLCVNSTENGATMGKKGKGTGSFVSAWLRAGALFYRPRVLWPRCNS